MFLEAHDHTTTVKISPNVCIANLPLTYSIV